MKKELHYAWIVCIGCTIVLFCNSGLTINAFSIYLPHILTTKGFSNAQLSLMLSFKNLSSFVCMMISARYFKLLSLRRGMTIAGAATVLALFIFGMTDSFCFYCVGATLMGVGYALGGMIPLTIIICNWFAGSRNTALGIFASATGIAALSMPPLINAVIEKFGLHMAFIGEGILAAILVFIGFVIIRDCPADKNMSAYGVASAETKTIEYAVGLKRKDWLAIVPMLLILGAALNVSYSNVSVLITGEGYSVETAAAVISVSGFATIISKILAGVMGDKIGNYKCNYIFGIMLIVGLVLCCLIKAGTVILFLGVIVFAAGNGTTGLGIAKWSSDLSSYKNRNRTIKDFQMIYALGGLVFSPLPGLIADGDRGSYTKAYILFSIFAVIVVIIIQCLYKIVEGRRELYESKQ